jgi:4-hydroxymandelate oxidase
MSVPASPVPPDIVSLADYERHAREIIPAPAWAYMAGAGADGLTRRWNREGFENLPLASRVLVDMNEATTGISLFGREMPFPLILGPVAFQKLAHPEGELAAALGAGAAGVWMTVSTQASVSLEQVAAAAHAPLWFQLYKQARQSDTLSLVRRAEDAGYAAIVLTVDAPVTGVRNDEQRAGFRLPAGIEPVNIRGMAVAESRAVAGESPVFKGLLDAAPTWNDVAWLRSQTTLPLLLKGVMNSHDARLAVDQGVNGIIVSNHGGRTLDTLPASIAALPSIVASVGDRLPVLLDGGVRRGTDILKALALGAKAVLIGQPIIHGLAVAGAVGVAHVIGILRTELEAAMALAGRPTIASIDHTAIWNS